MLNSKLYDVLKWICLIGLPAISGLIGTIGMALKWPDTETIVIIINAVAACIGTMIGVSTIKYNKDVQG